jgi:hypothetical protein
MESLKPCPFCGFDEPDLVSNGIGDYYVICARHTPDDAEEDGCGARTSGVRCESKEGAIERWNQRRPATIEPFEDTLIIWTDTHFDWRDRLRLLVGRILHGRILQPISVTSSRLTTPPATSTFWVESIRPPRRLESDAGGYGHVSEVPKPPQSAP